MKNIIETIRKEAKKIRMSTEENSRTKQSVLLFMQKNPVRETLHSARTRQISYSFFDIIRMIKPVPFAMALTLLIGSGISYAAESALPGNVLYPVKIHVNEPAGGLLALSAQAKAKWQIALAERRLNEAERLAVKGELDTETREELEANFNRHSDAVKTLIASFEEQKDFNAATEASSNFEISLRVHEQILSRLANNDSGENTNIRVTPLAEKIKTETSRVIHSRENTETGISGKANADIHSAAEGKQTAAENKLTEVKNFIDKTKANLDADAVRDASARLKTSEDAFAEGQTKLSAGLYAEAFILFQKTIRIAEEAKRLVEIQENLNLDIRLNSDERRDDENKNATTTNTSIQQQKTDDAKEGGDPLKINLKGRFRINMNPKNETTRETGAIKLHGGF